MQIQNQMPKQFKRLRLEYLFSELIIFFFYESLVFLYEDSSNLYQVILQKQQDFYNIINFPHLANRLDLTMEA